MDNKKTFALITAVVVVSLWILGFPMVVGSLGYLLSHQYPRTIIMIYLAIGGVSLGVVLLITRLKMRKGIVARIPIVLLSLVVAAALTPSLLVTPEIPLILPSLLILLMFIEGLIRTVMHPLAHLTDWWISLLILAVALAPVTLTWPATYILLMWRPAKM